MSDAVALFHPVRREALLPFLDLDDENEESEGIYAEALDDGSFLLHTFQPFAVFAESTGEARAWLAQFGDALSEAHDDPRGVLFFPDTLEPEAQTYAGVVAEVGEEGVFVAPSSGAEIAGFDPAAGMIAGIDPALLQALADQLLGGAPDGASTTPLPLDIAKLIEGVQSHMFASFGGGPEGPADDDDDDDGDDGDDGNEQPPAKPKK